MAAALTLALAYLLGSIWTGAVALAALGLLWLLEQLKMAHQGRVWSSLLLLLHLIAAALGVWLELDGPLLLGGVVLALTAWDLEHFVLRVQSSPPRPVHQKLAQQHLGRLVAVAATGLSLGLVALLVEINLTFTLALLFGLLLFLALAQVVTFLRRSGG